jgi:hypothetical protein
VSAGFSRFPGGVAKVSYIQLSDVENLAWCDARDIPGAPRFVPYPQPIPFI